MTDMISNHHAEQTIDTASSNAEPSPVFSALSKRASKKFRATRIARDAAIIEALGTNVKMPNGYGDGWADAAWQISDMLKGYGLDVSVRIDTVLVPRGHATAWAQRAKL